MPTEITDVISAQISEEVFKISTLTVQVPRNTLPDDLRTLHEVGFERGFEGEIFRGYVAPQDIIHAQDGSNLVTLVVEGLEVELEWRLANGIIIDNLSAQAALDKILEDTGWTGSLIGDDFVTLSTRYDTGSRLTALRHYANAQDAFLRFDSSTRTVEVVREIEPTGIVLTNVGGFEHGLVESFKQRIQPPRFNRIVIVGENAGNVTLDLGRSNRTTPYTIQSYIKNLPSVVNAQPFTFTDSDVPGEEVWRTSPIGEINVAGPNRVVVLFIATGGVEVASRMVVKVGGVTAEFRAAKLDYPFAFGVWYAKNVPEGIAAIDVYYRLDTATVDINGWAVVVQDVDQFVTIGSSVGEGTGSTATLTLTVNDGDLRLGGVSSTSVYTINSRGSGQVSVGTDQGAYPEVAVDSLIGADGSFSWTFSSSEVWFTLGVRLRGVSTYYLEDAASIAAYGLREIKVVENGQKFVGATSTQIQQAANTLYDIGAAMLTDAVNHVFTYDVESTLPNPYWKLGQSVTLDIPESDINVALAVPKRTQMFPRDGRRTYKITLSTSKVFQDTFIDRMDQMRNNLAEIQTTVSKK